jgi:hypothetical protein
LALLNIVELPLKVIRKRLIIRVLLHPTIPVRVSPTPSN